MLKLTDRDCWIFDMDGTLTIANHDFEAIRAELDLPSGQPILEALAQLPAAEAQPRWAKLDEIELEIAQTTQSQPGAGELLERLRSLHGNRIGILTRNSKSIAHQTLAACGLLEFFEPEAILSRDCCAPKPKPDGILQLLQRWDATPDRGVMVGDYVFDLLAGRNAGTATVHLDVTGSFAWSAHADCCVTELGTSLKIKYQSVGSNRDIPLR
jgi:HAD superfamily hydrolase (TIGR01509 family)